MDDDEEGWDPRHPTSVQVREVFGDDAQVTCISCPLQVEGTYFGWSFYFRSRHGRWRLTLGSTPDDAVERGYYGTEPLLDGSPEPDDQEAAGTFGIWLRDRLNELI